MDWKARNDATIAAVRERDLERAEALLRQTWELARTDELVRSTHFTEGMLRDAQGKLVEAEAAFQAALDLDRSCLGNAHVATADALRSVGLVRQRRQDLEGALVAFDEAAAIYRGAGAWARYADAIVHAAEIHRRAGRSPAALGRLAIATRIAPEHRDDATTRELANVWRAIGLVAKLGVKRCEVMAAFAFWYATVLASDSRAAEQLAAMDERTLVGGDPATWRFVYRDDADNVHVCSLTAGLHHAKTPLVADLGDVVDVALERGAISRVRRVS